MFHGYFAVTIVLLAAMTGVLLFFLGREVMRLRGARVVVCPETGRPAGVALRAFHGAVEALFGPRELELGSCTRWPEKKDCGQACLRQIETSPDGCLVKSLVGRFYAEKKCEVCHKGFGQLDWSEHRPALIGPDGITAQWHEVPVDQLPFLLATHRPLCWNCHIVQTLVRTHPDLPIVRPERPPIRA